MSIVDAAAKALAKTQGDGDWSALGADRQHYFRENVRVVLKALRDPDITMTEAGAEIIRNVSPTESDEAYISDAANTWRYMVDAVLGERE
jgi:hypothetical protein